jgi:hypothetical protein
MKQDIKERWVAALRSGEYKQAEGYLSAITRHDDGSLKEVVGHCCLGVLCEIAVADGIIGKRVYAGSDSCMIYGSGSETGALPPQVQQWAGLESADPNITYTHTCDEECDEMCTDAHDLGDGQEYNRSLSNLNDDLKLDFNQIAGLIEVGL